LFKPKQKKTRRAPSRQHLPVNKTKKLWFEESNSEKARRSKRKGSKGTRKTSLVLSLSLYDLSHLIGGQKGGKKEEKRKERDLGGLSPHSSIGRGSLSFANFYLFKASY